MATSKGYQREVKGRTLIENSNFGLDYQFLLQPLVEPIHYDVQLWMSGLKESDMEQQGLQKFFRFNSTSKVLARCNEETGVIVMHAGDTYDFEVVYVSVSVEKYF